MAALARLLALTALLVGALWGATRAGPPRLPDIEQGRLDTALPLLAEGVSVRQPFRAGRDGLREATVQIARYSGAPRGALLLWIEDDSGRRLAERRVEAAELAPNAFVTLDIPRQHDSAGQRYTLGAAGEGAPPTSLWGYSLDLLDGPLVVEGAASEARSLVLTTRYELSPLDALARAGALMWRDGPTAALALLFLLAPGALLLSMARPRGQPNDLGAWLAVALALGLAAWPLLWHGATLLGLRWSGPALWLATLAMAAGALARGWRHFPRRVGWEGAALALILLGAWALRLLTTGDLAFLPWVDSVRHATIGAVMAETGQTMRGYAPLLPEVTRFPYHFGFHALPASLTLMGAGPMAPLLLALQALLNALAPLALYSAARLMIGRRAALVAAFLVAFPAFFPAYYATWGRLTQLAGLLVLAPLAGLTWRMMRGGAGWARAWPLVGILAGGLFLVHARVFLFFLPFPALLLLVGRGRRTRPLLLAAFLAALLAAPRAIELAMIPSEAARVGEGSAAGYFDVPWHYFRAGWKRAWPVVAALALGAALVGAARTARGRVTALMPLVVAAWWAMLLGWAAFPTLLPGVAIANANSVVIALFVPLALVIGWGAARAWRAARRWPLPRAAVAGLLAGALLGFGARQQLTILNPQTILARPADAAAIAWAEGAIPRDAVVAINAWPWLNGVWAGSDGGAWLLPLAGIATTTPPADYAYDAALAAQVVAFNEGATAIGDWSTPEAAAWLRARGVTHLYVGARGGFLDPAELARNGEIETLYAREGVFWFRVVR